MTSRCWNTRAPFRARREKRREVEDVIGSASKRQTLVNEKRCEVRRRLERKMLRSWAMRGAAPLAAKSFEQRHQLTRETRIGISARGLRAEKRRGFETVQTGAGHRRKNCRNLRGVIAGAGGGAQITQTVGA